MILNYLLIIFLNLYFSQSQRQLIQIDIKKIEHVISKIELCGNQNEQVILVYTQGGHILREKQNSWKNLTDELQMKAQKEILDHEIMGNVIDIIKNEIDPQLVFFLSSGDIMWISNDCGETIEPLNLGRRIKQIIPHPNRKEWILASGFQQENIEMTDLYISKDQAKHWTLIYRDIKRFYWATSNQKKSCNIPIERIIIQDIMDNIIYSDNFFVSHKILIKEAQQIQIDANQLTVIQSDDIVYSMIQMDLCGFHQNRPIFPFEKKKTDIAKMIFDSQFLSINQLGAQSPFANLLIYNSKVNAYSISLKYNKLDQNGQNKIIQIEGLEGLYISNAIDQRFARSIEQLLLIQNNDKYSIDDDPKNLISNILKDQDRFQITYITRDNGAIWQRINVPQNIVQNCLDCSLNFDSSSITFKKSAVGIMMGNGNVGQNLHNNNSNLDSYLSTDGGKNWFKVADGQHLFSFGDHGGLILMASKNLTNKITFSWNEGETWETRDLGHQIIIQQILNQYDTGLDFLLIGSTFDNKSIIIQVDFSNYFQRECVKPILPVYENQDYELWNPYNHENCIMGEKIYFVKRRKGAFCYNGIQYERPVLRTPCPCTEEDWECDIGFQREFNGPCQSTARSQLEQHQSCIYSYITSSGYRKVPDSKCQNGIQFTDVEIFCYQNTQIIFTFAVFVYRNKENILIILLILFVFLQVISTLYNLIFNQNKQKNEMETSLQINIGTHRKYYYDHSEQEPLL